MNCLYESGMDEEQRCPCPVRLKNTKGTDSDGKMPQDPESDGKCHRILSQTEKTGRSR